MPSTQLLTRVAFALSLLSSAASAHLHESHAALHKRLPTMTYVGCFSSSDGLTENSTYQYQSSGWCQEVCYDDDKQAVLGLTNGNDCWCGMLLPPTSDKVDDSECDSPCTGYGQDDCGGSSTWSVYLTGTEANVAHESSSASSTTSASSTATSTDSSDSTSSSTSPSVVTSIAPGKTVVVTMSAGSESTSTESSSSSASASSKSSSTSTAGIAAGVVVGVVGAAAIAGGIYFFFRQKRRREAEEAYRKSQAGNFIPSGKGSVMRRPSGPESRIDTEAMAQRRMSDGSIADNEDYSRRILKVTNPDDGR